MATKTLTPWYTDDDLTLYHDTAFNLAGALDDNSVGSIITSPPYWNLRDYGHNSQWGHEKTVGAYVDNLVYLFGALMPKLTDTGTLWLNLGDTRLDRELCGIPWRVALDLQTDGWHLRQAVVWSKPNAMPESVDDRPSGNYEHVFLLSKSAHHTFNIDPLRVKYDGDRSASRRARSGNTNKDTSAPGTWSGDHDGRNPGSVWDIPVQPFKEAHCAVMPPALADRLVLSGSNPGDLVLDPFHGSGTTAASAVRLGRKYVGTDVSEEYLRLSLRTRLQNATIPWEAP